MKQTNTFYRALLCVLLCFGSFYSAKAQTLEQLNAPWYTACDSVAADSYNGGSSWTTDNVLVFKRNSGGYLTKLTIKDPTNISYYVTFTRNSSNQVSQYDVFVDIFGTGSYTDLVRDIFTYNSAGDVTVITEKQYDFVSSLVDYSKTTYTYNSSGYRTKMLYQLWNGSSWDNSSQSTYTLNAKGKPAQILNQVWNGASWDNDTRINVTYDSDGFVAIEETEAYKAPNWEKSERRTYTYNGNDKIESNLYEYWNTSAWVTSSVDTLLYNQDGLVSDMYYEYSTAWAPVSRQVCPSSIPNPDEPKAPSSLTASFGTSEIDLSWTDNSPAEENFIIYKSTNSIDWSILDTVAANTTSYNDTAYLANTTYYYYVRAYDDISGKSTPSNIANVKTPMNKPVDPTTLNASYTGGSIDLTWTDNATEEDGFIIYRSDNGGLNWVAIDSVGMDEVSYSDGSVSANSLYQYKVSAYNTAGESGFTNTVSVSTFPLAPDAPTSLTATVANANDINLSWADNSTNEEGYIIERSPDGTNWTVIDSVGVNVNSYSDMDLSYSTAYYYRVRAYNVSGTSLYTNTANVTTDPDVPAAPTSLTASVNSIINIHLSWTNNATTEQGFHIERSPDGTNWTVISTEAAGTDTYDDNGLAYNTKYYYRVAAYNTAGEAYSNTTSVTTGKQLPNAPTSLVASLNNQRDILLNWNIVSSTEEGFEIERSLNGTTGWTVIDTVTSKGYLDAGLAYGTTYYYRVRAYNSSGVSAYSNVANNTTLPAPPADPTNLVAIAVSYNQVNLSWTDNATNEDNFEIFRSPDGNSWTSVGVVGKNTASYQDKSVVENTTYWYRVNAFNTLSVSGFSNIDSATTPSKPNSIAETENLKSAVSVYPNPSNGKVTLRLNSAVKGNAQLNVVNISGQVLYSRNINTATMTSDLIDMSQLPAGIYTVQLSTQDALYTGRIVIQK